ncbi:hypothetical protein H8702_06485 [Massilimaliae timonensis]|uniref:Uncharacterized protein n=1 Tax=Massiliimalia timonensis TaxID=1987501 RepID=A0A8J6P7F9_9FIRM|nr:hypothetical protein [Massiliimalia timonensis]MBC8610770.1 hypothetical protein [Massiliimalia timonensis]
MILTTSNFDAKHRTSPAANPFRHTYLHELSHNIPIIVIMCLTAVCFLILPAVLSLVDQNLTPVTESGVVASMNQTADDTAREVVKQYVFGVRPASILFFPVMAFVLSLVQFSYLTNRRAMDVFGTLPIRRGAMMRAKMLAGVTILAVPVALSYLVIFFCNLIIVGFHQYLILELLVVLLNALVVMLLPYGLTALISTISGTIMENILYPLALLSAPVILYGFIMEVIRYTMFGYAGEAANHFVLALLSPFCEFFADDGWYLVNHGITQTLLEQQELGVGTTFLSLVSQNLIVMGIWLVISAGLMAAAVFGLRRRKNERAGLKGASRVLNHIACFLAALIGGALVLAIFSVGFLGTAYYNLRYVWFFVAILITFVAYQLIVLQSVKAMLKTWPLLLVCVVLGSGFVTFVETDAFGAYTKIPEESQVHMVSIDYSGIMGTTRSTETLQSDRPVYYNDPDLIQTVLEFHQQVVEDRIREPGNYQAIRLEYKLKDGSSMVRQYTADTQKAAEILATLNENDSFLSENHVIFTNDLSGYDIVQVSDPYYTVMNELTTEQIDLEALQQALQQDVMEQTLEDMLDPQEPEIGWIHLWKNEPEDLNEEENWDEWNMWNETAEMSILVKGSYQNTIAYLESIGAIDLMQPDYTAVQDLLIVSPTEDGGFDSLSLYGNTDPTLSLFTKNWLSGLVLPEEFDGWITETIPEADANRLSDAYQDPDKVQSILEDCYNQHGYDENSCVVYVKTMNATSELILPNS